MMTAISSCHHFILLFLVSSYGEASNDDSYSNHDNLDDHNVNVQSRATSLALITTSDQESDYGNKNNNNGGGSSYFSATSGQKKESLCAFYDDDPSSSIEISKRNPKVDDKKTGSMDGFAGVVYHSNNSALCPNYCFSLWVSDQKNKSKVTVSKQGCWMIPEGNDCHQNTCINDLPPRQNNTHFCCCTGHMCNMHFKAVYNPDDHTTTTTLATSVAVDLFHDHSYKIKTIVIALVSVVSVSLVIVFLYLAYRLCLTSKPTSPQSSSVTRVETPEPLIQEFNVDDLKIEDVLVRGRYSEIRRGWLKEKEVAVKIYQPHHRQYYYNERNAFTQPFMDHENIVKFLGAKDQEDPETNVLQYLIVTKYIPLGSLTSYLKHNHVDWFTLCHMCQSVSRGLAYLHTDIQKNDLFKPAIAHRDLNTRNILVNSDLSCMIADLGFSVGMIGSKIIKNGIPESAEQATLADVGTLRYMAPEVFDGAVNLRDCEASLKQIDVYALGLVIWEIASRCIDLYQGAPVPEYQLPFQAEAGTHPTFEEMQVLVVKYKTRPRFPEVWKDANPAVRSLKETIEDCWDTDAEARLTSLCVQERISDIAVLWIHGTKYRGVTPTLNATMNLPESSQNSTIYSGSAVVSNGITYLPSFIDRAIETNEEGRVSKPGDEKKPPMISNIVACPEDTKTTNSVVVAAPLTSNGGQLTNSDSFVSEEGRVRSWLQDQSLSGSTMDTLLPPTPPLEETNSAFDVSAPTTQPSDHHPIKASNVLIAVNKAVILHPNQGRNPTVERNTHKRSDEELTVSGNVLIGPGNHIPESDAGRNNRRGSLGTRSAPPNRSGDGGSFDGTDAVESSSLMQNDSLGLYQVRQRNAPIPYFQNHVHGENIGGNAVSSYLTRPKLANVSGNRNSYLRLRGEESISQLNPSLYQNISEKPETSSLKLKLSKLIRPKNIGLKFSQLVFGGKHKKDQNDLSSSINMEAGVGRNEDINRSSGQYINSGLDTSPIYRSMSNVTPNTLTMEVEMINGAAVTRACNDANINKSTSLQNGATVLGPQGRLSATNVMRFGVLANSGHDELQSSSLFPKNSSDPVVDESSYLSDLQQRPLQHLTAKIPADYGSMEDIIVNQTYNLDTGIQMSRTDLSEQPLAASSNDITKNAFFPDSTDRNLSFGHQSDLLTQNHPNTTAFSQVPLAYDNKSVSQSSVANIADTQVSAFSQVPLTYDNRNVSQSSVANIANTPVQLTPVCACDSINTVIQSPTNKTICSINKPPPSLVGCSPNLKAKKDICSGTYSEHSSTSSFHLQNHHTDTKGGNSIMHCLYIEGNINQLKEGSQNSGWSAVKSSPHELTTAPHKNCINNTRQNEEIRDVNKLNATAINVDKNSQVLSKSQIIAEQDKQQLIQLNAVIDKTSQVLSKSQNMAEQDKQQLIQLTTVINKTSQVLSKSQNMAEQDKHQSPVLNIEVDISYITNCSSDQNLQEVNLNTDVNPLDFIRPQSLSLNGHNYNQNKKSSSLSSVSLDDTNLHNDDVFMSGNNENSSLTSGTPELDKEFTRNEKISEKEPAIIPTDEKSVIVTHHIRDTNLSNGLSHVVNSNTANYVDKPNKSQVGSFCGSLIDSSTNATDSYKTEDKNSVQTLIQDGSDSREKIRKRIKTPVSFKKSRLSLYDDRLMSQSQGFVSLTNVDGMSGIRDCVSNNLNGSRDIELCGVTSNGVRGRNQDGNNEKTVHLRRADYYKMVKSESDLVV